MEKLSLMWHKFPHLYVKTITTINFPLPPTPTKTICLGSTILNSCVDYMYLFCSSSNVLLLLLYHAIVSDRRRRIFQLPTFSLCNSGAITKKKKEKSVFGTHLKADCVCDSSICRISSAPSSANNIRYQFRPQQLSTRPRIDTLKIPALKVFIVVATLDEWRTRWKNGEKLEALSLLPTCTYFALTPTTRQQWPTK